MSDNEYPYYSDAKIAHTVREDFSWHIQQRDTWKFGKKAYQKDRAEIGYTIRIPKDSSQQYTHSCSQDYIDDAIGNVGVDFYLKTKQHIMHGYLCFDKVNVWREEDEDDILINISTNLYFTRDVNVDKKETELKKLFNKHFKKKYVGEGIYCYESKGVQDEK